MAEPTPAAAPQNLTTLLSPVDSKFYSVPTAQVADYLKAGYATPLGRDISRQRILNGYNGWGRNLEAAGAALISDIPFANTAITSALAPDLAKRYAQETANLQEASPFITGATKVLAPVAAVGAAVATGGASVAAEGAAAAGEAALGEGAAVAGAEGAGAIAEGAGAATEAAAGQAAKRTLAERAAAYAPEVAKSAAINAGVGTAGRMDEAAIAHALDPEGHERFQFDLGDAMFDAALGGAFHVGLTGVGKAFKGLGHGLDYLGEKIRGRTASVDAAASGVEAGAQTAAPGSFGEIAAESAVPTKAAQAAATPPPLGDKPLSAAAQRLADLKAEAAAASDSPLREGETPTARAQAAADYKQRIATLESMTPEEIVQAHTDPEVVAAADRYAASDPFDRDIFAGQEHGEAAKDVLRDNAELDTRTLRARLKGIETDHNSMFNQIEFEQKRRGGFLPQPIGQKMLTEARQKFGHLREFHVVNKALRRELDEFEVGQLTSKKAEGRFKTESELAEDRDFLEHPGVNPKLDLRDHQNAIRVLDKAIGHDSIETTKYKPELKELRNHLSSYLDDHFRDVQPGDVTAQEFRKLQKDFSVNKLAQKAAGLDVDDPYHFVNTRAQKAQGKVLDAARVKSANADMQLQRETERFAKAKARSDAAREARTTKAEQAVAREEYAAAERAHKEAAAQADKLKKEAERAAEQQRKNTERLKRDEIRQVKAAEAKAAREQAKKLREAELKEAKFGHAVQVGVIGAITHGLKGSLIGAAGTIGYQLLKGIPASKWVQVAERLSTVFKAVDGKMATAVEAGLFGLPADMHRALEPNDYNAMAAKVMAARNGPENAYRNLAQAHLEADMPDVLLSPLVQNQWNMLQALGKAIPSTAGAPGVYSEDEPDVGQKLVWMGQVKTASDPTYGVANPTPENLSMLKQFYPQLLYKSQQAALLEVQQNPDVSLEGKLWASALCERPLTALASSQFMSILAGARQQSDNAQKAQAGTQAGNTPSRKVQSSMSRMDSLQNQDA